MAKHRSFKLDKFLKAVNPELRSGYFSSKGITFPDGIGFDDDGFDDFWDGHTSTSIAYSSLSSSS